jgi:hypothetical protein
MAKKQTTKVVENPNDWKLVHIMGHGKTRINEEEKSKEVDTTELATAQAVIDFLYSKKPTDRTVSSEFHVITFAKGLFARFVPKASEEKAFSIKFDEFDGAIFSAFLAEVEAKATEQKPFFLTGNN